MNKQIDNISYGSISISDEGEEMALRDDDGSTNAPTTVPTKRHRKMLFPALVALLVLLLLLLTRNGKSIRSIFRSNNKKKEEKKSYANTPRFYEQRVDHLDESNTATWSNRYYAEKKYFRGPGHPIFLEVGGEGGNDIGMFYGFVDKVLARTFGAYVLHPEHRFFGISQPLLGDDDDVNNNATTTTAQQLLQLLTPEQAMLDMLAIAQHYRKKLGCSLKKSSKKYCPLIPVGGSYPGAVAAWLRLLFPDIVDMAYASSAPLLLYSKQADQYGYYDVVTEAADRASPGCSVAVKAALNQVDQIIRNTSDFSTLAYNELNVCTGSIPAYINNSALFSEELMQIIESSFADANMIGNYPPSNKTWFASLCHVFQDDSKDSLGKVAEFWKHLEIQDNSTECFFMDFQLSEGSKATISSADWSGQGPGRDGRMWDFMCCTSLTPEIGFSEESMFPNRNWTYDWLTQHCTNRFGVVGDPQELVKKWHFDDLVGQGATRIIFTNGLNDMWSAGSHLEDLSESLPVINMENGAHHSEVYARKDDTKDIKRGQEEITKILDGWLKDIKKGSY